MLKKLRSKRGTTLMEVLVAAALMGILATGISVGISAAGPVCGDSLALSESSILFSTLTQIITDELRYARNIEVSGDGDVTFTSDRYGEGCQFCNEMTSGETEYAGRIWIKSSVGTTQLVGDGAYTNLTAELELSYSAASEAVERSSFDAAITITRGDGGQEKRSFKVYPILS